MTKSTSEKEQYELVLRIDQQMRRVVSAIPSCLLHEQPEGIVGGNPWLNVARHSLTITAADKVSI